MKSTMKPNYAHYTYTLPPVYNISRNHIAPQQELFQPDAVMHHRTEIPFSRLCNTTPELLSAYQTEKCDSQSPPLDSTRLRKLAALWSCKLQ